MSNIKRGIESFKASVIRDCKEGENCFNENGCDHEFTRMVPSDNPKLIEMGFDTVCKRVSKCFHKYCDKYKWTIDRAKLYAEKSNKTLDEVMEIWENNRTYWYMNYYQEGNQNPNSTSQYNKEAFKAYKDEITRLENKVMGLKETILMLKSSYQIEIRKDMEFELEKTEMKLKQKKDGFAFFELNYLVSENNKTQIIN
jgi:hypothetical protein